MARTRRAKLPTQLHATSLEIAFRRIWQMVNKTEHQPIYQFRPCLPRQFRVDAAFPHVRLAIELEGGIWLRDRNKGHASPKELLASMLKNNWMVVHGWRILRYEAGDLEKRPVQVVEEILDVIERSRVWGPMQKPLPLDGELKC
jgi:very-short-patch-repair endonuclease